MRDNKTTAKRKGNSSYIYYPLNFPLYYMLKQTSLYNDIARLP